MSSNAALTISGNDLPRVLLHPTVVISILTSHMRRTEKGGRVVGSLLGNIKGDVVEVTDCFMFPHTESVVDGKPNVTLDMAYANSRLALHKRVNKVEQVVGWFATTGSDGASITDFSPLIHECYSSQCQTPVHIVVDTTLAGDNVSVKGFVSAPLVVDGRVLANVFSGINVEYSFTDSEISCLHLMQQTPVVGSGTTYSYEFPNSQEQLTSSLNNMICTIDEVLGYVDKVIEGTVAPSSEIADTITSMIASLQPVKYSSSKASASGLKCSTASKQQDLAMASYLMKLTHTQAIIAEKLNSIL